MLGWGVPGKASAEHGSALQGTPVKPLPSWLGTAAPSLCRRQGEGWGGFLGLLHEQLRD